MILSNAKALLCGAKSSEPSNYDGRNTRATQTPYAQPPRVVPDDSSAAARGGQAVSWLTLCCLSSACSPVGYDHGNWSSLTVLALCSSLYLAWAYSKERQKRLQLELELLNASIATAAQSAVAESPTASEQASSTLVSICSACKSIRSQSGEWTEVERYLAQCSPANFSHGFCPTCSERLYGSQLSSDTGRPRNA